MTAGDIVPVQARESTLNVATQEATIVQFLKLLRWSQKWET